MLIELYVLLIHNFVHLCVCVVDYSRLTIMRSVQYLLGIAWDSLHAIEHVYHYT